jgi:hypothetical protein
MMQELAHAAPRLAHRERSVRGDRVGGGERGIEQRVGGHDAVDQADLGGALRVDRARGEHQLVRVHPADLAREHHRRVAGRVETARHLLEREGRMRHRIADLRGEQDVAAERARVSVHGAHERCR